MKWIGFALALLLASPAAATINSPQVSVTDAGNGSTTVFNYPFLVPFQSDGRTPAVQVQTKVNATGVLVNLTAGQYTISGVGSSAGGAVTYNPGGTPLPMGMSLVITRALAYIQPTAVPNSTFYPHTVETVADNLDAQIQQLNFTLSEIIPQLPIPVPGPVTLPGLTLLGPLLIPGTGQFYPSTGAVLSKVSDRLFIGPATLNDGNNPATTTDWLTTNALAVTGGGDTANIIWAAQMAVLSGSCNNCSASLVTGAHNAPAPASDVINTANFAWMDSAVPGTGEFGWAVYNECENTGSTGHNCVGVETDVRTLFDSVQGLPDQLGTQAAEQLDCGAGVSATGQFDCGVALAIGANPKPFKTGINFGSTSIDTINGQKAAIAFASGQSLIWYASNIVMGLVEVTTTNFNNQMSLIFNDSFGMAVLNHSAQNVLTVNPNGTVAVPMGPIRPALVVFANLGTVDPAPQVGDRLVITDASACTANVQVTAGGGTTHSCAVVYNGVGFIAEVTH